MRVTCASTSTILKRISTWKAWARGLVALGHSLVEHYGPEAVYRVDGDDFVVELGDREPWIPKIHGVPIKHAILDVALSRNPARNHHVHKWIMMNVDAACLAARIGGASLTCGDPPGLTIDNG